MTVKHQLQETLKNCPYFQNQEIHVEVNGSEVTLSGTVKSYYKKQVIQEIACQLLKKIANDNFCFKNKIFVA